jgi:hypothetical protein
MELSWKHFVGIGGDLLLVCVSFYFGHWFGFAVATLFITLVWEQQILAALNTTRDVLLSRLPNRCGMCHRKILDEGGTIAEDLEGEAKLYHDACAEKLDAIKEREKLISK